MRRASFWKCKACSKQYSVKVGTIFEDSAISLGKWLIAIWLIVNAKNGISSYELGRSIGVTQRSAWHMNHRIRLALQNGSIEKLSGHVEADETYIGGKARNMHVWKRQARLGRGGVYGKVTVLGLLERGGKVITKVVAKPDTVTLASNIFKNVDRNANLYTDSHWGYDGMKHFYEHQVVNHADEYVRGNVHTNGIENFWSLLKRALGGTYISVEPFHLFRYIDEQAFRFNHRKLNDAERFENALRGIVDKRLTFRAVTGKERLQRA